MPPLSLSSFKNVILYELFENILADFPVWMQMSQAVGCISTSLLLWSLHISKVFLLCGYAASKNKSSPKRFLSEPKGDQQRLEAFISSCLYPDCLGCSLACILMFAFFFSLLCPGNCKQLLFSFRHSPSGPLFPSSSTGRHIRRWLADWQCLLQHCLLVHIHWGSYPGQWANDGVENLVAFGKWKWKVDTKKGIYFKLLTKN